MHLVGKDLFYVHLFYSDVFSFHIKPSDAVRLCSHAAVQSGAILGSCTIPTVQSL